MNLIARRCRSILSNALGKSFSKDTSPQLDWLGHGHPNPCAKDSLKIQNWSKQSKPSETIQDLKFNLAVAQSCARVTALSFRPSSRSSKASNQRQLEPPKGQ